MLNLALNSRAKILQTLQENGFEISTFKMDTIDETEKVVNRRAIQLLGDKNSGCVFYRIHPLLASFTPMNDINVLVFHWGVV